MDVIAEGIEDQEQLSFLRDLNCRFGQGFVYYKSLTSADVEERILSSRKVP